MNSVFDTLFLRAPRLHYVSPAICEVLFSSSAEPTIVLDPISRYNGPTGPVRGGTGGNYYFRWSTIPGLLCYTVYRAENNEAVYTPLYECLDPNAIVICAGGTYEIFEQTAEGETSVASFACDGNTPVITVVVSTVDTIGYKVVKNGVVTLWEGIMPPIVQICDPGCYKVSGISPDGETALSDEICYECTEELICDPSEVWSWDDCACVACPEEPCVPGTHWDAATCQCIADAGPCTSFMDAVSDYDFSLSSKGNIGGVAAAGTADWDHTTTARHYSYRNRVENTVTTTGGFGDEVVCWINAGGDLLGNQYAYEGKTWVRTYAGAFSVYGHGAFGDGTGLSGAAPLGITDDQRVYTMELENSDGWWYVQGWHPTEGVFFNSGGALGDFWGGDIYLTGRTVSPGGWVACWRGSLAGYTSYRYKYGVGLENLTLDGTSWSTVYIDDSGRIACRLKHAAWSAGSYNLAYFDGSDWTRVTSVTPGACTVNCMNNTGTFGGIIDGLPFIYNTAGGLQMLPMPDGATVINNVQVSDAGIVVVKADNGPVVWVDGAYAPITTVLPLAAGWTQISNIYKVNYDGYATGWGTYMGSAPTGFVAKMCAPA